MNIDGIEIGPGHPVYVVAEIGINHNGSVDTAKQLIDVAKEAGCQAVKFQKRTVDAVYTCEELAKPRDSVFGKTNGDLKRGLEFGREQYEEIDRHCKAVGITWFASPWDVGSVEFLEALGVPAYKVASACVTDIELLQAIGRTRKPVLLSTGMSEPMQVVDALATLQKHGSPGGAVMQCTSVYPCPLELCHVRAMAAWAEVPGYSGHELGWIPTLGAVALGALVIERHITLSRIMWGSDQRASLEPDQLSAMVRDIRDMEKALGEVQKRVHPEEFPALEKLRRFK